MMQKQPQMLNKALTAACAAGCATLLIALAGCDGSSSPDAVGPGATTGQTSSGSSGASTTAPTWLLADAPQDAVDVGAAKSSVAEGDQVTIRGRIGGRSDPISTDAAVFIIVDTSVPSCAEIEGDNCPTPWDYCCEPRESLLANNATIQLIGDQGAAPLGINLRQHGLEPLDEVIVIGRVGPRPTEQTLVIHATALHKPGA